MPLPSADPSTARPGRTPPFDLRRAIYRTPARRVARWVGHLGGPSADVDDLVHEIFLVADRRLPEFRGDAKLDHVALPDHASAWSAAAAATIGSAAGWGGRGAPISSARSRRRS